MRKVLITLALFAQPALAASPIAEIVCDDRARMEQRLTTTMRSERQATGLRGPEQMMELWTEANGDWALVVTYASGKSCIVAMGESWQPLAADPA